MEENPWKIIESQEIYDNPWINLKHYTVLNPSGKNGVYGKVHFKNIALGVIPLDDQLNTWIVGQYRFPLNSYSWEIVEGGGALDVDPVVSAKRELKEEAGIVAEDYLEILRMHLSNSVSDELGIVYVAKGLTFVAPDPEETELLKIRKLNFSELLKMTLNGEITDSLSVAGILKCDYLLKNGII